MAELMFFGLPDGVMSDHPNLQQQMQHLSIQQQKEQQQQRQAAFNSSCEYLYQERLYGPEGRPVASAASAIQQPGVEQQQQQEEQQQLEDAVQQVHHGPQWVYLRFSQPVTAAGDSLVIGSKLDADLHTSTCRLAFHGRICCIVDPSGGIAAYETLFIDLVN
jgi:selenocysteine-specific elongation factor